MVPKLADLLILWSSKVLMNTRSMDHMVPTFHVPRYIKAVPWCMESWNHVAHGPCIHSWYKFVPMGGGCN